VKAARDDWRKKNAARIYELNRAWMLRAGWVPKPAKVREHDSAKANKPCRKCGAIDRYPSGGCKPCALIKKREYAIKNAEKIKANRDKWRAKNATRIYELARARLARLGLLEVPKSAGSEVRTRKPHTDKSCRKCGAVDRDPSGGCRPCGVARNLEYRAKNADKVKAYLAENADKVRRQRQNRRARLAGAGVLSEGICEALHAAQMGRCACCGLSLGVDYDLDHVMPLALGGLNIDANMQLLMARCNGRKLAKHPEQYAKERGFSYWPARDWASVTRAQ
jgi:hypothetical protein